MSRNGRKEGRPAWAGPAAAAALLSAAILGGCGGDGGGQGGPGRGGFAMPPTPVEVSEVRESTIVDQFKAVGTVESADAVTMVSEIDGLVIDVPFLEGTKIARGSLIAKLDDEQLRAQVARAEALRDQRRAAFERVKAVVEQGAGAPQDLDDSRAALQVAEADLDLAAARLAKTRITSPFEGVIGARKISPGAWLRAGQPIAEMARTSQLRVSFSAPERRLPYLEKGAAVRVTTPALPGYEVEGRILAVEPVVDPATRSARVTALVDNVGDRLRPGMSANITATLSTREGALTVPSEAVFVEGEQALVYRIQPDSTVARVSLSLGLRLPGSVEVTEGLSVGDRIVRTGHQKLYPGAKVMPVSSRGSGDPGGPGVPGGAAGGPPGAPDSAGTDQRPGGAEAGGPGAGPPADEGETR